MTFIVLDQLEQNKNWHENKDGRRPKRDSHLHIFTDNSTHLSAVLASIAAFLSGSM